MIHGDMRTYLNGKKKSYNAHGKAKNQLKSTGTLSWGYTAPRRARSTVASLDTNEIHTAKVEPKKYTGSLVKGISTMHKSNAVPVLNKEEMKDHAAMRR